jgi:osmotically-inducible protein OsmY
MTPKRPLAIFFAFLFSGCAYILRPADLSDLGIKARAEEIIQNRKEVDVSRVSVDVIDGIVTLSGIISSPD